MRGFFLCVFVSRFGGSLRRSHHARSKATLMLEQARKARVSGKRKLKVDVAMLTPDYDEEGRPRNPAIKT